MTVQCCTVLFVWIFTVGKPVFDFGVPVGGAVIVPSQYVAQKRSLHVPSPYKHPRPILTLIHMYSSGSSSAGSGSGNYSCAVLILYSIGHCIKDNAYCKCTQHVANSTQLDRPRNAANTLSSQRIVELPGSECIIRT